MDNINVVRVGFLSPQIGLVDSNMESGDPIDRSGQNYTCLIFVNPDKPGAEILQDIQTGLPPTAGGSDLTLSAILPCKSNPAKAFKDQNALTPRIFCDYDLRFGDFFNVINSASARPAYHPTIFIIGDEGTVRYRQLISEFDSKGFRTALSKII